MGKGCDFRKGDQFDCVVNDLDSSVEAVMDYTVIKKLETKGFIRRDEPGFICTPTVTRAEMQKREAVSLLNKVFGGSRKALFSALLEDEKLTESETDELRRLIEKR